MASRERGGTAKLSDSSYAVDPNGASTRSLMRAVIDAVMAPKGRAADRLFEAPAEPPPAGPVEQRVTNAAINRSIAEFIDSGFGQATDQAFEGLDLQWVTAMASHRAAAPIGMLSILTPAGPLYLGLTGLRATLAQATEVGRRGKTLCAHVAAFGEVVNIPDTTQSPGLNQSSLYGLTGIKSFYGVPFRSASGTLHGALCVADTAYHEWDEAHLAVLRHLAEAVAVQLQTMLEMSMKSSLNMSLPSAVAAQLRGPIGQVRVAIDATLASGNNLSDAQRESLTVARRNCVALSEKIELLISLSRRVDG